MCCTKNNLILVYEYQSLNQKCLTEKMAETPIIPLNQSLLPFSITPIEPLLIIC